MFNPVLAAATSSGESPGTSTMQPRMGPTSRWNTSSALWCSLTAVTSRRGAPIGAPLLEVTAVKEHHRAEDVFQRLVGPMRGCMVLVPGDSPEDVAAASTGLNTQVISQLAQRVAPAGCQGLMGCQKKGAPVVLKAESIANALYSSAFPYFRLTRWTHSPECRSRLSRQ